MKVAVIGYGRVGMAVFNALLGLPEIHELALVGRDLDKIAGELADYLDAQAIDRSRHARLSGGGYEQTRDADILVYTVGTAVSSPTQSRLEVASASLDIARAVSAELNRYNREAPLVVLSNPLDIMVQALTRWTGRPRSRVIGTGTLLDSARLSRRVADILEVRPQSVSAWVLGEHGDSSAIIWSALRVLGMPVEAYLAAELGADLGLQRERLHELNRRDGFTIFARKGHTCYGVAAAAAQIVSALIHDTHEIMPASVALDGEYGIAPGVALSVPCSIGAQGARVIGHMQMTAEELAALRSSAAALRAAFAGLL